MRKRDLRERGLRGWGLLAALGFLAAFSGASGRAQVPTGSGIPSGNIPVQTQTGNQNGYQNGYQTGFQTGSQAGSQAGSQTGRSQQNGTGARGTQENGGQNNNATDANGNRRTGNGTDNAGEDGVRRGPAANSAQEVPTEFQRLVEESTGTTLPIFGANLFSSPETFAPVSNLAVSPDYVIGVGDELRIQVFGAVTQQGTYTVDRNGNIALQDVGDVHVAGVPYAQLQTFLKSQLSRVFRNFDLNVNLGQLRSIQIFVTGAARRPGTFTVSSLSTLLNALFASGGPLPQGTLRDIEVIRGNEVLTHFDLYNLLLRGDKSQDVRLQPGDVIFIPPVGAQVAVTGSVNNPAIYEIKPGTTVKQLVALTGGNTSVALGSQVRVERIYQNTMRSFLDVNLAAGDLPLENGDIVTVGTILDRFKDAVTLRGNVAFPGRYAWRAGLRITDVVPNREGLITREYYRRLNQLGNTANDFAATAVPGGALGVAGTQATATSDAAAATGSGGTGSGKGGGSVGSALTASSTLFGAANDIVLAAPDVDLSYATIVRLNQGTMTTSLIPFSPGKLYLDGDQSQNLALLPGDVITFFSTADIRVPTAQQTRTVRLEGEFMAPGVYSVAPGETFRQLLARAGGLTPDAYLYGSEFTRLSTKRVQQQRLNEFADNLESQVALYAAAAQSRAVSDRDTTAATASAAQGAQVVARLRRLVPQGRIVLELKPDSRGIDAVPDLPLEEGDRFVVPRVPSTVSVEGQVYSANSYVYERGRKQRDYLRQAGGPDREADTKREFILRADGSVFSRQYGNVDKATMFPGDTIVVPPQIDRRALLRNVLDFSTIVSQLGLGLGSLYVISR